MRWAAPVLAVALASCTADTTTKLGADGESCLADDDCRLEFLCVDGVCGGASAPCAETCAYLEETCALDVPECPSECASVTRQFGPERIDDYAACTRESPCRALGDAPLIVCATHNCDSVCSRLSECGLEAYDTCRQSCEDNTATWTRRQFGDFQDCFFRLDCNELDTQADTCFPE